MLLTRSLPEGCRQQALGMPIADLSRLPGWSHLILARAHQAGFPVFITDVDTAEQLEAVIDLLLDGIQTNRIEVIGPLVAERRAGDTPSP
jgi:glycerophosphoryl diester phosphodiesterase